MKDSGRGEAARKSFSEYFPAAGEGLPQQGTCWQSLSPLLSSSWNLFPVVGKSYSSGELPAPFPAAFPLPEPFAAARVSLRLRRAPAARMQQDATLLEVVVLMGRYDFGE